VGQSFVDVYAVTFVKRILLIGDEHSRHAFEHNKTLVAGMRQRILAGTHPRLKTSLNDFQLALQVWRQEFVGHSPLAWLQGASLVFPNNQLSDLRLDEQREYRRIQSGGNGP
jgi:hypothetical protein